MLGEALPRHDRAECEARPAGRPTCALVKKMPTREFTFIFISITLHYSLFIIKRFEVPRSAGKARV